MKIKKIAAMLMAAITAGIAISASTINASAYYKYYDWDIWSVKGAPGGGPRPGFSFDMPVFSGGYQTYCSSISGSNDRYVQVSATGMSSYSITTTGYSAVHYSSDTSYPVSFSVNGVSYISTCQAVGTLGINIP
jgi:hypothetical protein